MKSLVYASLLTLTATLANAATHETVITCQQEDGDQWLEVGIALADGPGLIAYVVQHNDDDDSVRLVKSVRVSNEVYGGKTVYTDSFSTFKLSVNNQTSADLSMLADGPGSLTTTGLLCNENSTISFDPH